MPGISNYTTVPNHPIAIRVDSPWSTIISEPAELKKPVIIEQRIDVKTVDGNTVSTFAPTNEALLAQTAAMDAVPDLVYRRMNFIGEIPREYAWTIPHNERPEFGGFGHQRMTYATWKRVIQTEGSTHAGPTGERNLPRLK